MKKLFILPLVGIISYLSLTSLKTGASATPQGASVAITACSGSGCHGGSAGSTNMTINVIENGKTTPVTDGKYLPGKKYQISIIESTPAVKYGFIALIKDNANKQAGMISNPLMIPNVNIVTKGGFTIAEHSNPISPVGGVFATSFTWDAPAAGTGKVTMYVTVNCTNGNGVADAMDYYAQKIYTLNEGWPASVEAQFSDDQISIFPNPAKEILNIGVPTGKYNYTVYSINGIILANGDVPTNKSIDISSLASGNYFIQISDGSYQRTIQFRKI